MIPFEKIRDKLSTNARNELLDLVLDSYTQSENRVAMLKKEINNIDFGDMSQYFKVDAMYVHVSSDMFERIILDQNIKYEHVPVPQRFNLIDTGFRIARVKKDTFIKFIKILTQDILLVADNPAWRCHFLGNMLNSLYQCLTLNNYIGDEYYEKIMDEYITDFLQKLHERGNSVER